MEMGPWFYDKTMLLLEEPKEDTCGEAMEFWYVSFLIHFHKLPFACFFRESATTSRSLLGKVEVVDLKEENDQWWGCSL